MKKNTIFGIMKKHTFIALALIAILAQGCRNSIKTEINNDDSKPLEEYSSPGVYSYKSKRAKPIYTFPSLQTQRANGRSSLTKSVRYMNLSDGKMLSVSAPASLTQGSSANVSVSAYGITEVPDSSFTTSATLFLQTDSLLYFTDNNNPYAYIIDFN